jgi:hypothetical protein
MASSGISETFGLVSGTIGGYQLISGALLSGYLSPTFGFHYRKCKVCGEDIKDHTIVRVYEGDEHYHRKCTGYESGKGFVNREKTIRSAVPVFAADLPNGILADYLEEIGRHEAADYIRGLDAVP